MADDILFWILCCMYFVWMLMREHEYNEDVFDIDVGDAIVLAIMFNGIVKLVFQYVIP